MTVFTLCRSTETSSTAEEEMVNLKKKIQFKKKGFTLHRERKNTNFLLHHLTALRDQSETKKREEKQLLLWVNETAWPQHQAISHQWSNLRHYCCFSESTE